MKLGSLFDGSGTAPLAATICGIEPVWASEIEPYPIKVTKARFPNMKHLGSILDINGAEVEPVDIICGGSPCQDLSVAGKQKGLHEGERSHLFFEMTRIIKEMRDATNGQYPRYIIWENVPGAFSSNNGRDFLAVLQAFAEIADPDIYVPEPPFKGKTDRLAWQYAGSIVGNGYSIAWRTVDAQYWGVPQRRRRIYLVADLASERAGEILFERTGVSGNSEQGGTQRQEAAADVGSSVDRSGGTWSLSANVYALQGNGIDRADTAGCNGKGWRENECYTLNTIDRPAVVYDCSGNGDGERSSTLTGDHENRVADYTSIIVWPEITGSLCANSHPGSYTGQHAFNGMLPVIDQQAVIYPGVGITSLQNASNPQPGDPAPTLSTDSRNYLVKNSNPPRRYIIRRLTPLECCRLQGFPDWWEEGVEGSDSARYKMWGNGMALPNMLHVMRRLAIAEELRGGA